MVFPRETPRVRWLILSATWVFVGALSLWHTYTMRDYVAMLNGLGRGGSETATPLRRPCPGSFSDSHAWVRYAIACQEGAPWQVRFTDDDNAAQSPEVHWNSAF